MEMIKSLDVLRSEKKLKLYSELIISTYLANVVNDSKKVEVVYEDCLLSAGIERKINTKVW